MFTNFNLLGEAASFCGNLIVQESVADIEPVGSYNDFDHQICWFCGIGSRRGRAVSVLPIDFLDGNVVIYFLIWLWQTQVCTNRSLNYLSLGMKLFTVDQIAWLDKYTIDQEPILSINLMERAAYRVFDRIRSHFPKTTRVTVLAGPGNNGGDGLALARLFLLDQWDVTTYLVHENSKLSNDADQNLARLTIHPRAKVVDCGKPGVVFPRWDENDLIVDALLGAGLNRPCKGVFADVIQRVNESAARVWSIDLPSGLMGEANSGQLHRAIVRAHVTLTFQFPKLAFLMPENEPFVGRWEMLDIGIHPKAIEELDTPYRFMRRADIELLIRKRARFAHKGDMGHVGLLCGSRGKMGAAVLAAKAALRSGAGLVTAHVPLMGEVVVQTAVPEAMVWVDGHADRLTELPELDRFQALGIGPGMGTAPETAGLLHQLLVSKPKLPMVLDADALNILSMHKEWLGLVPPGSILTPHPGEMDRLTHRHDNAYDRLESAREFARERNCIVVVKGAFSQVVLPNGTCCFNGSGTPGMATAGSGDALTGLIAGLLAQGYDAPQAALLGVYWHGRAGEVASRSLGEPSMLAGDLIGCMGEAYIEITTLDSKE